MLGKLVRTNAETTPGGASNASSHHSSFHTEHFLLEFFFFFFSLSSSSVKNSSHQLPEIDLENYIPECSRAGRSDCSEISLTPPHLSVR